MISLRVSKIAFVLISASPSLVLAQDEEAPATQQAPVAEASPAAPASPQPEASPSPRKKASRRENQTEGSEAPSHFETDTVIKSQYTLDGQPLEVDPD